MHEPAHAVRGRSAVGCRLQRCVERAPGSALFRDVRCDPAGEVEGFRALSRSLEEVQRGSDRAQHGGKGVHQHGRAEQALEVPAHRLVRRDTAREDHGRARRLAREHRVGHVAGETGAQPVADLLEREAGLLRVHEVRAGEHGAAGGDPGRLPGVGERRGGQLPTRGEPEPSGLLVEEAAGARGARRVRFRADVAAGLVEADQREPLAAHAEDRADRGDQAPARRHERHDGIDRPGGGEQARPRARDPDPRDTARREPGDHRLQGLPHLPQVRTAAGGENRPRCVQEGARDRDGADVDSEHGQRGHVRLQGTRAAPAGTARYRYKYGLSMNRPAAAGPVASGAAGEHPLRPAPPGR